MKEENIDLIKHAADNEQKAYYAGVIDGTEEENKISQYWKTRCQLAEGINKVNVADPDLTSEMIKAYADYIEWRRTTDEPINKLITEFNRQDKIQELQTALQDIADACDPEIESHASFYFYAKQVLEKSKL